MVRWKRCGGRGTSGWDGVGRVELLNADSSDGLVTGGAFRLGCGGEDKERARSVGVNSWECTFPQPHQTANSSFSKCFLRSFVEQVLLCFIFKCEIDATPIAARHTLLHPT